MGSIKKNLITTTTTTTKQNKTHAYFPIYSLSLIFKVTARAACLLTYLLSAYFSTFYRTLCISQFQLRPAPPPPFPPGLLQGISPSFQSRGGAFANFALLGGRAFDIPGAIPSSWHARRFLSAYNYTEDITRKKRRLVHLSRTGACKGMFSILCTHLLWLIKPELHNEESGAIDVNQRFLVGESNFGWYFLKNILSYL